MRKSLISIMVLAFVALFCSTAFADLTVSSTDWGNWGNKRARMFTVAFDSSYASGGESLDYKVYNMAAVDQVIVFGKGGYQFEYDKTNKKLKVFSKAPPMVYEEKHTISGNSIVLRYPAAFLVNVAQANSNVKITTSGATLISTTDECQPYPSGAFSEGTRSGVTFGTAMTGVVYVTYATQAWREVWSNLVQNESVTLTSNSGALAYRACAIQAATILGGVLTNSALMIDKDDTVASGEIKIDWTSEAASTLTGVSTVAGDTGTTAVMTYVKYPSYGYLADNFVEEETALATPSGVSRFSLAYDVLLWGYGGQVPVNAATTQRLINNAGTPGPNEAYMRYESGASPFDIFVMGQNAASTTATYIKGKPADVDTTFLEVPDRSNLSALTDVKVIMIGR